MGKKKENANDKLTKWMNFGFNLDTSETRDLNKDEEKNPSKTLDNISAQTDTKLFKD